MSRSTAPTTPIVRNQNVKRQSSSEMDGSKESEGSKEGVVENRKDEESEKRERREDPTNSNDRESKKGRKRNADGDDSTMNDRRRRKKRSAKSRRSRSRHRRKSSSSNRKDRKRRKDRKSRKRRRRRRDDSGSSSDSSSDSSSSSSSSSSESSSSSSSQSQAANTLPKRKVTNLKLQEKLARRGETLEEREERRAHRRSAQIASNFGYTAQDNPFNDPNLADTFTWKKKEEVSRGKAGSSGGGDGNNTGSRKNRQSKIISEINKVRTRRVEYQNQREEMERIRYEEAKMKELEKYDDWAAKEEAFHLQRLRQRSAIRLVEKRERPIDVLAKNLLLFGLTDEDKKNRAAVKYKEAYNAMDELETLEVELEEPHVFLNDLKEKELRELDADILDFKTLEREAANANANNAPDTPIQNNPVLRYWDALHIVTQAEIQHLNSDNANTHTPPDSEQTHHKSTVQHEIQNMFEGQSNEELQKMKHDVEAKLRSPSFPPVELRYWNTVLQQLIVHLAKIELSDIHSKMLVCQLEKLEKRKEELGKVPHEDDTYTPTQHPNGRHVHGQTNGVDDDYDKDNTDPSSMAIALPRGATLDLGNLEEELGLADEVDLAPTSFAWQERYRPRKPRYFNRVKTGYDWNKYNQTHYDHDNPPPKTVQGYKFNVFYPDLIDKTKTPTFHLEAVNQQKEFCIIRFTAGPPYEDIAFKIINQQWNRSRKRGYRSTFERGILTLYFNFASHWYRR